MSRYNQNQRIFYIPLYVLVGFLFFSIVFALSAQDPDQPPARPQFRERNIDPPPPPPMLELTEKQKAVILNYIKTFDPVRYDKLKQIESSLPEQFDESIIKYGLRLNELRAMREHHPERYQRIFDERKIDDESFKLAQAYKNEAMQEEKLRIQEELKKALYIQFEDRQKIREEEILRLEQKIQELKANLEKRQEKIDEIVEERLRKLLELNNELSW